MCRNGVDALSGGARGNGRAGWAKDGSPANIATGATRLATERIHRLLPGVVDWLPHFESAASDHGPACNPPTMADKGPCVTELRVEAAGLQKPVRRGSPHAG